MTWDQADFAATQTNAIRVVGDLDMAGAEELARLVATSLAVQSPLLIDLTEVSFIDVAGWRAIWDTVRPAPQTGTKEVVAVVIASAAVMRLLKHLPMERCEWMRIIQPPERQEPPATRWWRSEMFDQIGDAVIVADEKMNYLDANAAAVSLLGWSVNDLRERTVADVVAAQRAWTEGEYERFVRDGSWRGEVLLRSKSANLTADAQANTIVGPDGARVFVSVLRQHFVPTADADPNGEPHRATEHHDASS